MTGQTISIPLDNGAASAYLAAPDGGGGPAILLMHAWWGLIPFFKEFADRLSAEGYVVLALDLYKGKTATTIDGAQALLRERDIDFMENAAVGALKLLRQHPLNTRGPLAVIGFSMGAAWATVLAAQVAPEDIRAAVLFYGASEGGDLSRAKAAFQGHFAAKDDWEPEEGILQTEEDLRKAGREVSFYRYDDTGHWFMEADKPDHYNAAAAQLAWERMLVFLKAQFAEV